LYAYPDPTAQINADPDPDTDPDPDPKPWNYHSTKFILTPDFSSDHSTILYIYGFKIMWKVFACGNVM
jgi:hypothetical protein